MKNYFYVFTFLAVVLFASACQKGEDKETDRKKAEASINIKDLEKHVVKFASDEFQGREPSTIGEKLSTEYLEKTFKEMGFEGAFEKGSFFQKVPIVTMQYTPDKKVKLRTKKGRVILENTKDYIATTPRITEKISIKNAPVVGFGIGQ